MSEGEKNEGRILRRKGERESERGEKERAIER